MESLLILDDEENVGQVLVRLLRKNGFECVYASNTAEAREATEREQIALIVSDIRMPGESGLDFVRWARAKHPDIPVIMLTGVEDTDTAKEALQLDVYGYILKPFEPNQVLICVLNGLRRRDLESKAKRHLEDLERIVEERTVKLWDKVKSLEQAQKALSESEERYRTAIEFSNDGVVISCKGTIVYANQRYAEIHGYEHSKGLIGKPVSSLLHPDDVERMKANNARKESGEEAASRDEARCLRKDGTSAFVEVSVSRIIHKGEPSTLVFLRDITERKAAEEALRESESRYRKAIELSNDGVAILYQGKYVYVNQKYAEIHGYGLPDEMIGESLSRFLHPDEIERVKDIQARRERGEDASSRHEVRCIKKNGEPFLIEVSASKIIYNGNLCTLSFIRDITQRKKTEEALRESEESFRAISESAQDGIIKTDRRRKIVFWNKAAQKIYGYTAEEAIGRDVHELLAPHRLKEDHILAFREFLKERGTAEGGTLELVSRRKDGEEFQVEVSFSKISGRGGSQGLGILRDVTERKRLVLELEQTSRELCKKNREIESSREKLASALDEISSLIQRVAKEKDFSIRFGNPSLVKCHEVMKCGQTTCPCHGKEAMRCWQVSGTYCNGQVQGSFARKIQNCCQECGLFREVTQDPILRVGEHFNNMMYILESKNKSLQEAYKELKNSQAFVIQQEKMASIGQLAAGVAHEINNPTGFISSNLKTLSEYLNDLLRLLEAYRDQIGKMKESTGDCKISEDLKHIEDLERDLDIGFILEDAGKLVGESREGTERIKKIVQDLKDFAHPGKQEMVYADINRNLESTLNIAWNEIKYKAKVKKLFGSLPEIRCYPQQMNQVFMNILMNAAQAIEKEGQITIATRTDNGHVEIRISDTGIGIPEENLSRIFEPFFTTKEVGKGTGLGLNVAYNIVKKHRGTIEAVSVVGKGTTFTVRIPVVFPDHAKEAETTEKGKTTNG